MGYLLETDEGLTTDWSVVKRVYGRFDKRRDWAGPVSARIVESPPPVRKEETWTWLDTGSVSTNAVKGPSAGAALEELMQMVRALQIAQARRDGGE